MKRLFYSRSLALALAAGIGLASIATEADAKRLGGGRSIGKQSTNVDRQAAPAQPATPAQQQSAAAAKPATPPAAAPAPARNRWLGPLAGLAAGLGIAALLSHFGLGGAFAEAMMTFLLIGLALMAVMLLVRLWKNRNTPAMAGAGAHAGQSMLREAAPQAPRPVAMDIPAIGSGAAAATAAPDGATWHLPADFDVDNFLHIAKMYFVRMQAAWDAGDDRDLRNFTTPEMYAHLKVELTSRAEASHTEVVKVEAQLLGLEDEGETTLASVRLTGLIRESQDGAVEPFSEVWNLQKPATARASWVLAGIQQEAQAA
jgi:predicted lipid-binding transport protein (Tim44 family)